MKILLVDDYVCPVAGGAAERSMRIGKCLIDHGHQVDLLTLERDYDDEFVKKNGINKVYRLPSIKYKYLIPLKGPGHIQDIVKNYDVVHLSKNWSLLGFFAAFCAKKYNIPYIFSPMGFVTVHNNKSRFVKYIYLKYLTTFIIKNASFCIAVSNQEYQDCLEIMLDKTKVKLIPNGFVADDFTECSPTVFRKKYNLSSKKMLMFLGRMDPIKGVHLLLEAYDNLGQSAADWQLVIIGPENKYRKELMERADKAMYKDSITFVDPLYGDEKRCAYYAADLFVIPSLYDAMTIVALEAAACGKPILITETSDFPGLAANGASIQVAPTVEGIEDGLKHAIDNPQLLASMGSNAKVYVYANFDWNVLGKQYDEIFNSVAKKT